MSDEDRIRILYLDDSPPALQAVEMALDPSMYRVKTAGTLGEALPWVRESDIVIVDFHMPGMNGAEAAARLRQQAGSPSPDFYLYTTDTGVAVKFRAHGFDGAFTDKGNTETLKSKLSTAARLIKMRRLRANSKRP